MARADLAKAKDAKKDEFYTQLIDIEKELRNYKPYFKDKVVFCNCDDPYESNFFKYFALNFNELGLKKLMATCYNGSPVSGNELLLDFGDTVDDPKKIAYKVEITEVADVNGDGAINLADIQYLMQNDKNVISILKGNGSFDSPECVELLKQADIVVTNPPFSLFREYLAQLEKYDKQFIIIGNTNALTYKETFRMFQQDKIRTGYTNFNVGMFFAVPDTFEKYHHIENGQKMARVSTSCWFTNLPVAKHKEDLVLYKHYTPEEYPRYDNYDAINVNTYTDIPCDYEGVMGVPITFLDKYNPDQFEIVALGNSRDNFTPNKDYINPIKVLKDGKCVNGGAINCVLAIRLHDAPMGEIYYTSQNVPFLTAPYARILIRKK
ncbi:MAG: adenine-specific methyltransferase EcoRI family protein [Paludibacteraceae bacterium]|nr:adenine-specific methyltransferase EcoRI family protein [Paludibacteraceae bacterium]